jgi:hypothetical protein
MKHENMLNALVVHESWFGNTATVAQAVASALSEEGFQVRCVPVAEAPLGAVECDLLVVGAATHAFGLSRPATRLEAIKKGATDVSTTFGVREWLDQLPKSRYGAVCAAAFDTRANRARRVPFSAAPAARRRLLRDGFEVVGEPVGFVVEDVSGPLREGEVDRAFAWGRGIAVAARDRLVTCRGIGSLVPQPPGRTVTGVGSGDTATARRHAGP